MLRKSTRKEEGFTLAELLIVVAIIAVLVAISIPIFTTQLEKSRESTDMSNIRAAYAEVVAAAMNDDTNAHSAVVTQVQAQNGWQTNNPSTPEIVGVAISNIDASKGHSTVVKYVPAAGSKSGYVWIDKEANVAGGNYTVN